MFNLIRVNITLFKKGLGIIIIGKNRIVIKGIRVHLIILREVSTEVKIFLILGVFTLLVFLLDWD